MKKKLWKKRLLSILIVLALVLGIITYTKISINAEVNEKTVVVTKVDIPPRTKITKDMLTTHTVPSRGIPLNAVTNPKDIIGKWTIPGYGISKNSFIYEEKIVKQDKLPDAGLLKLKENEVAVPLLVDLESSLGNSIIPDTYIDLYFRNVLKDKDQAKALYGKLASQIRVVAVKDAQAANVFDTEAYSKGEEQEETNKAESMAKIYIFAVPPEIGDLINKAKLLGEVIPVSTGKSYDSSEEELTVVEENEVIDYIEFASYKEKNK